MVQSSRPEAGERAVRMVEEHRGEYASLWTTVDSTAPKAPEIGCAPQTLLEWVKRDEVYASDREGKHQRGAAVEQNPLQ